MLTKILKGIVAVATFLAIVPGLLAFFIGDPSPFAQVKVVFTGAPVEKYFTNDPLQAPEAQSTSDNLLGVTAGMAVDDIVDHFGGKSEVTVLYPTDGDGWRKVSFVRDGVTLNVIENLASGSTTLESLSLTGYDHENYSPPDEGRIYASLPGGLLLGHSTTLDAMTLDVDGREMSAYGAMFETAEWTEVVSTESSGDGAKHLVVYRVDHGEWGSSTANVSAYDPPALTGRACEDLISKVYFGDETWEPFTESSFVIGDACQ